MLADLFRTFRQGFIWLWEHPAWTLPLVLLGTLLQVLAPWIQLRAGLPDHPMVAQALIYASTLPLTLYGLPRFLLFLDAHALDGATNPKAEWVATFEARWPSWLGSKVLLGLAIIVGFFAVIVPGLMIWAAFGWAPTLVLLRGFDLKESFRGSLRIMALHTPKVLFTVLGAVLLLLLVSMVGGALLPGTGESFTPQFRLRHPAMWAFNALETLCSLWLSATLLALFHQVEGPAAETEIENNSDED